MINGLPVTNFQMQRIRVGAIITGAFLLLFFLTANIINSFIIDGVEVESGSYTLQEGFPLFNDQKAYINFIKNYPHDPGVKLVLHNVRRGETLWTISRRYRVTIATLIGANPYLMSLQVKENNTIVVPRKNGVLFAFDDFFDVGTMKDMLSFEGEVKGEYLPSILKLISNDDVRLVFFENSAPVQVNPAIATLYRYHRTFNSPLQGHFTSMFGDRVDPFFHSMAFHNGIDIQAPMGRPIKAAREGMVIYTGWRDGYGKSIIIQHRNGYSTMYGHLSHITAKKGDWVTQKTVIGRVGSTGRSTGPHLHFMLMHHGRLINPLRIIW